MSIIGISGRMGSGKDTVGKIIQDLTGFSDDGSPNWEIKKFAKKLKTISSILTGIPEHLFEEQDFKKTYLDKEWNLNDNSDPFQIRLFLQRLGTDAVRDVVHNNAWVNALFADYKKIEHDGLIRDIENDNYPKWLITDVRFENELEAIKRRDGLSILIIKDCYIYGNGFHYWTDGVKLFKGSSSSFTKYESYKKFLNLLSDHESEKPIDFSLFDYVIENNGSIEDLTLKVKEILIKENLLNKK
jgi:hypothetical protein